MFRKMIPKPRNPRRKQSLVLSRWLAFESRGDPVSSHEKFDQVSGWNTRRATGNFFWKSFQCKISGFFQVILTRKYKKDFKWKDPKKFFLECMSLNHSVFLGRLQLHPKRTPPSEVQRRQWWLAPRRPRRVARFPPALKWPRMPRTSQL